MTIRPRSGTVLVIGTAVLVSACGGGSDRATSVILSDDGCVYSGKTTLPAGRSTIAVENATNQFGAFAIASLADDATTEELQPFLEQAEAQFEQSGMLPAPPAFYEQVMRTGVEAGSSGELPADLTPGRYALMCFVDDPPTWRAYATAQLEVDE